jgi:hypothetical protein
VSDVEKSSSEEILEMMDFSGFVSIRTTSVQKTNVAIERREE